MSPRNALRICFRREHLRRTVKIALVVGTILTLINQGDVIPRGDATSVTVIKTGLNYCGPLHRLQPRPAGGEAGQDGA